MGLGWRMGDLEVCRVRMRSLSCWEINFRALGPTIVHGDLCVFVCERLLMHMVRWGMRGVVRRVTGEGTWPTWPGSQCVGAGVVA